MTRSTAREIAIHLAYQLSFTELPVEEFLTSSSAMNALPSWRQRMTSTPTGPTPSRRRISAAWSPVWRSTPPSWTPTLKKYARGWRFERISLVASAIMRVAMYEILYMADIPQGAAISEAVTIAKKYETPEVAKFINGILGSFARGEVKEKD